jgi:DNA-binding NtrC family response regulator
LKKEIAEGRFREDLYHRLSVILIKVPSLAERKEDIPFLVEKFLNDIATETGAKKKEIKADAIYELEKHPWTGNIRELRNVTERLVIMGEPTISLKDVKKYL